MQFAGRGGIIEYSMKCESCPIRCGAERSEKAGSCGVRGLVVAKYYLHPYEEPFLSPNGKSGTVFFSGCSLRCKFCQNFELSRSKRGKTISPEELADIFRELEETGAENIDLVTPDHLVPFLVRALQIYKPRVPVVYNSSGYALVSSLESIEPYIDIWLPDCKFFDPQLSKRYTGREDYPAVAKEAIAFMAKKPLAFDTNGRMLSGIAVRHLVLPSHTEDSKRVLDFLKTVLPENAPLSLMRQYTPMGEIEEFPELNRKVTDREYDRVKEYALSLGFSALFVQEKESADPAFIPKWDL